MNYINEENTNEENATTETLLTFSLQDPYFETTTNKNVTVTVGTSAYLPCKVKRLGGKSVSMDTLVIAVNMLHEVRTRKSESTKSYLINTFSPYSYKGCEPYDNCVIFAQYIIAQYFYLVIMNCAGFLLTAQVFCMLRKFLAFCEGFCG